MTAGGLRRPLTVIASQRVRPKAGPMINSAKQSRSHKQELDCFVARAPRNDVESQTSPPRAAPPRLPTTTHNLRPHHLTPLSATTPSAR
jgi:hypothetical protein